MKRPDIPIDRASGRIYPVGAIAQRKVGSLISRWLNATSPDAKARDPIQFMRDPGQMVYDMGPEFRSSMYPAAWRRQSVFDQLETGTQPVTRAQIAVTAFSDRLIRVPTVEIYPIAQFKDTISKRTGQGANPPWTPDQMSVAVMIRDAAAATGDPYDLIWSYAAPQLSGYANQVHAPEDPTDGAAKSTVFRAHITGGGDRFTLLPIFGPESLWLPGALSAQGERTTFRIALDFDLPTPTESGNQYTVRFGFWQRVLYTEPATAR